MRTLVVVALSVGLLALALRGAHLERVWSEIKDANLWLVGASGLFTVFTMVLRAWRWQYLLAPVGHARFRTAFRATMIGFAANAVLPRSGELIRPYLFARQERFNGAVAFATIVVERLLDSVIVVLMLASFVLLFDPGLSSQNAIYRTVRAGGVFAGIGTVVLLGIMFFAAGHPEALGRWAFKLDHLLPGRATHALAMLIQKFAEGLAVVRAPSRLLIALALSVPLWMVIALTIWTVTQAFGVEMAFTGSFLVVALLAVGVSVPTPGGIGGFEAAVQIALTSFFGVSNDRAVGTALVLHAASILPTLLLAAIFLVQDGLGVGSVRNLASAAAGGDVP